MTLQIGIESNPIITNGRKTMFVGKKTNYNTETLCAEMIKHNVKTVSFDLTDSDPAVYGTVIRDLLVKLYTVVINYNIDQAQVIETSLPEVVWQMSSFVPVATVAIPNISTSGTNFTVRIADTSNDGVWCLRHNELTDPNRFIDWDSLNAPRLDVNAHHVSKPITHHDEVVHEQQQTISENDPYSIVVEEHTPKKRGPKPKDTKDSE